MFSTLNFPEGTNTNWWEDAHYYDWRYKSFWNSTPKSTSTRINPDLERYFTYYDSLPNSLPLHRRIEKPDKNRIFIKEDTKFWNRVV